MQKKLMSKIKSKVRGTIDLDRLKKDGLIVGNNFHAQEGTIIDPGHCWLIEIGDNVTLAPRVHILAHDASTKNIIGYTKLNTIHIGNNVFIGAGTIILPGSVIPNNTIIGAGSLVNSKLKQSGVYVGSPCQFISSIEDYKNKQMERMKYLPKFDENYTIGKIDEQRRKKMKDAIDRNNGGFII